MPERLETSEDARGASGASPDEPSDEALEAEWKAGSTQAFAVLFQRYHARVFAFALKLTGDRHLAEDLAQRAFLNLYRKPPPGTGRATFKALVFTVVRNESLNELKRRGRRREGTRPSARASWPKGGSTASSCGGLWRRSPTTTVRSCC
jgi:RNA polymerase sigma-70 factor (ECF subfamily)